MAAVSPPSHSCREHVQGLGVAKPFVEYEPGHSQGLPPSLLLHLLSHRCSPSILDCTAAGNMVKPFVDPATHKKIRFLPNDLDRLRAGRASNLQAVLRETMPEELLNWWVGSY